MNNDVSFTEYSDHLHCWTGGNAPIHTHLDLVVRNRSASQQEDRRLPLAGYNKPNC
jgi:hypothetical protein